MRTSIDDARLEWPLGMLEQYLMHAATEYPDDAASEDVRDAFSGNLGTPRGRPRGFERER